MSEYWKSTPNYWCKFCETYVRDTKLERQQHEATGRHQGNIQRSLRNLHKTKEREERDKQRAKDEVARLNGVVGGAGSSGAESTGVTSKTQAKAALPPAKKTATIEDRKRQMAQLAEMGIAIPEEYRQEMAMPGEVQRRVVVPEHKQEPMIGEGIVFGVRKRKHDNGHEEEEEAPRQRRAWGTQTKTYPGASNDDLDDLLSGSIKLKKEEIDVTKQEAKEGDVKEEDVDDTATVFAAPALPDIDDHVKTEEHPTAAPDTDAAPAGGIIFKKRKPKRNGIK